MSAHAWHFKLAAEAKAAILAAITQQPAARKQISEITGIDKSRVSHYMRILHADRQVHVVKWIKQDNGRGQFMAVFAPGAGKDAPKPKAKSKAQQSREFRRRLRKDPSKHLDYLMKTKIRDTRRRPPPPADPMFAWIPRRAA